MAGAEAHREIDVGRRRDPSPTARYASLTMARVIRAAIVVASSAEPSGDSAGAKSGAGPDRSALRRRRRRTPCRSCARAGPRRRAAPGSATGGSAPRAGRPPRVHPSKTPRAAARLTSSPTRSMSSNGPIGKPLRAHRRRRSPRSWRWPASSIASASSVNGRLTRLTMKPGVSGSGREPCPTRSSSAVARSTADAADAFGATTTSTSGMTGAGLKKWSPSTRSGREVARRDGSDRQRARVGREDGGRGRSSRRAPGRSRAWRPRSSRAASTTRLRLCGRQGRRASAHRAAARASRSSTQLSAESASRSRRRRTTLEPVPDARPAALDRRTVDVVDPDRVSGLERELRDPGAHRPGPDHTDRFASERPCQIGLMASNGWRQSAQ